jgi:ribosomal protein S18 acetylase RimI-like enzyme
VTTSWALRTRLVAYTDPLVLPMLAELSDEYSGRYGEGHGFPDLQAEQRRGAAEFAPPDGGVVLLIGPDGPVSGGAFRRYDTTTAELKRIWTASRHRRRGLARHTLSELEREIAARQYRRIYLTTGPRQPEAVGLYRATGYTPRFDESLPPERIGKHAFTKELR